MDFLIPVLIVLLIIVLDILLTIKIWHIINRKNMSDFEKTIIKIIITIINIMILAGVIIGIISITLVSNAIGIFK